MPPRNFSEDGAVGAHNGAIDTALPDNGFGLGTASFGGGGWGGGGMTPQSDHGGGMSGGMASPFSADRNGGGGVTGAPDSSAQPPGIMEGFSSFAEGGAIDEATGEAGVPDNGLAKSIQDALGSVGAALAYGRKLHGIGEPGGDEQQMAGRMPTQPGNQSESGMPREQPMPGPLPPTSNPFGKRADASIMPAAPFSETPREQPMPGPLPPTDNPFGKRRADAGEAIATDDEEAA